MCKKTEAKHVSEINFAANSVISPYTQRFPTLHFPESEKIMLLTSFAQCYKTLLNGRHH